MPPIRRRSSAIYGDLLRDRATAREYVDELRAETHALRTALKFYAKQRGVGSVLASDGGKIAREALQRPCSHMWTQDTKGDTDWLCEHCGARG